MQRYQRVTQNELEKIHETSLRVLAEVGVVFTYEPAREVLVKAGAKVDGQRVYLPPAIVEQAIKDAPSSFTVHARQPENNLTVTTESICFLGPGGPSYVADMDQGRRLSLKEDFINFMKLEQMLEHVGMLQMACELNDVEVEKRHLEIVYAAIKYSSKPYLNIVFTYEEAKQVIAMFALPHGGLEAVRNKPVTLLNPCTVTPLSYDDKALSALMAFAEYGQPMLVNSLCMAGATSPATIVGSIVVQNAEILAGITLAQLINPGTPVVYSASGSNVDMRTGFLTIGSPEDSLFSLINGQLAKYYDLPCRMSGSLTDSKCVDAQAGYESMMNLMTAEMAGANFVMHACGILESYNVASFEKLITDHEMVGMLKRIRRGVEINDDTLAFEVIKEVGPQGEFLTHEHTFMHFRNEHYTPFLNDRQNIKQWEGAGSLTAAQRANLIWKEMLAAYKQPDYPRELENDLRKLVDA